MYPFSLNISIWSEKSHRDVMAISRFPFPFLKLSYTRRAVISLIVGVRQVVLLPWMLLLRLTSMACDW